MKLLILLTTITLSIPAFSQKDIIAITSFEASSSNIPIGYIKGIEDKVKEAFYATNRFDIVDRTNLRKLQAEKELQKNRGFY